MSLAVSPAARAALADWLSSLKSLRGASPATIAAYQRDVVDYLSFMAEHQMIRTCIFSVEKSLRFEGRRVHLEVQNPQEEEPREKNEGEK